MGNVKKTSWKKGQSGNPKGRPRDGMTLTDIMKEKLDKEKFVEAVIKSAKEGNAKCQEMIWNRIDGPITTENNHNINDFTITIKRANDKP